MKVFILFTLMATSILSFNKSINAQTESIEQSVIYDESKADLKSTGFLANRFLELTKTLEFKREAEKYSDLLKDSVLRVDFIKSENILIYMPNETLIKRHIIINTKLSNGCTLTTNLYYNRGTESSRFREATDDQETIKHNIHERYLIDEESSTTEVLADCTDLNNKPSEVLPKSLATIQAVAVVNDYSKESRHLQSIEFSINEFNSKFYRYSNELIFTED